jgi:hypothetical protein
MRTHLSSRLCVLQRSIRCSSALFCRLECRRKLVLAPLLARRRHAGGIGRQHALLQGLLLCLGQLALESFTPAHQCRISTELEGIVLHCTALNRHPQHRQQVAQEAQPAAGSAPVSQLKCDRCRLPPLCRRLRVLAQLPLSGLQGGAGQRGMPSDVVQACQQPCHTQMDTYDEQIR